MNDELTAQLTARNWKIPRYAQKHLWLVTDSDAVQPSGDTGLFELTAPARQVSVRWGAPDGAVLTVLTWQVDNLEWDGSVSAGGYVDSLHLTTALTEEVALAIVTFGGQPLKPDARLFAAPHTRGRQPIAPPDFFHLVDDSIDESTSTWIVSEDSPLLTIAQDAMMNKLRVIFNGQLADQSGGWADVCALPLLLEGVTLFAP